MLKRVMFDSSRIAVKQLSKEKVVGSNFDAFTSGLLFFVKIDLEGFDKNSLVHRASLKIENVGHANAVDKEIEIIECNNVDFNNLTQNNTYDTIKSSTSVNTIVRIELINKETKSIDLTDLVKKALASSDYDDYLIFAVRTSNTSSLFKLDFKKEFDIVYSKESERNEFAQYKSFDLGFAGKLHIDLLDGKLVYNCSSICTNLTKPQLSYPISIFQPSTLLQAELGNGVNNSFYNMSISEDNKKITITSCDGSAKEYHSLEYTSKDASEFTDEEKSQLKELGVKLENVTSKIWYCYNDSSYLKYNLGVANEILPFKILELFDSQNNVYTYHCAKDSEKMYLGTYKSFKEDTITFTYDQMLLTKINNNFNEELLFTYSVVNNKKMLTKITKNSSKDTLNISYDTDSKIKTITYLTKGVDYNYYYNTRMVDFTYDTQGKLTQLRDNLSGNKTIITYSNDKVSSVETVNIDKNKTINKVQFEYFNRKYNKVKDFRNNELTYMFNSYGQCFNIFDNHKRYLSASYETSENGLVSLISEKSMPQFIDKNLIFNGSFENEEIFSTYGWRLTSGLQTSISKNSDGVGGNSCLKVIKNSSTPIKISQVATIPPEIESKTITLANDDLLLTGYVKCIFNTNTVSNSDFVVKMVVSCVNRGDQTFSWSPEGNINEWQRFTIKGDIQGGSTVSKIEVFIELNGQNCEVYLDDINLTSTKAQYRYNVVSNGYFDKFNGLNNPIGWQKTQLTDTDTLLYTLLDDSHPSYLGRYVMKFSKIVLLTSSLDSKKKSISQVIDIKGLKNDHLVFSGLAKGQFSNDANVFVKLHFNYLNEEHEDVEFKFLDNIEDWQLIAKEIVAQDDYDQVTLTITSTSVNETYVDAIQLYKDSLGTHYAYNKMHNIESITNNDGTSMIMRYNDDNNVEEIITNNGEWFKFYYENKELTLIEDNLGNKMEYLYDDYRNCIRTTLTLNDGTKIAKQFRYDDNGIMCIEETDELGNVTEYGYDNNNTTYKHGLLTGSITNDEIYNEYVYNEVLLPKAVKQKLGTYYYSNNFEYSEKMENSKISNENVNYSFGYDDFGRVENISIYNILHCINEYSNSTNNINHNVLTKQTFDDGTIKEYIYDNQDNVISTKVNNQIINEFKYDERNYVSEFIDNENNEHYHFDYLGDGKMKKVVIEGKGSISYGYDNLGNLQKSSFDIDGINKSYDYINNNEFKSLSYYYIKLAEMFNDDIVPPGNSGNSLFGAPFKANSTSYNNINEKYYSFKESSDYLWYDLSKFNTNKVKFKNGKEFDKDSWLSEFEKSKVFYTWIKPQGSFKETSLFTFQTITDTETEMLGSLLIKSDGKLAYKSLLTNAIILNTSNKLKLEQWNLVCIQYNTNENGAEYIKLSLNGVETTSVQISPIISRINHLIIGLQSNSWDDYSSSSSTGELYPVYTFTFDLMLFGVGTRKQDETFKDVYDTGLEVINNFSNVRSDGISYYNTDKLTNFEIVSLNGTLESNKGLQPHIIEKSYNMFNEVENFVFDNTLNRQVFKCFENKGKRSHLGYVLGADTACTLTLRFKYESNTSLKPLISLSNGNSEKLLIAINLNNELRVRVNDYEYSQYIPLTPNKWYEVMLSMNSSSGLVYIKGSSTLSFSNSITNFKDCIIKVGTNKDNTLSLNGYIERLGLSNEYVARDKIQEILGSKVDVVLIDKYDSIGRLTSKSLNINDLELTNNYNYKPVSSNHVGILGTSTLVEEETLLDGRRQAYTYDSYGNVLTKTLKTSTGVILEEERYRYDKLFNIELVEYKTYTNGVLSKSMMEEYGYDSNGNIQTINKFENDNPTDEITTNYKWSYPDVMTGVHSTWNGDRISLTYTLSDRFKPNTITKNGVTNNLIWSGNNLIQCGEYRYSYDSLGRRIRKAVGNVVRTYVYEGSKLIGETIKDNNVEVATLIYNYDQYGKLIGLSINEKEYIYIRDVLGNINGIIDQEGNVIVYYKCDVWGKLIDKDIKEDNLASRYNPFIYKGYYYDVETQLYWVSSRYYYPEIYRWISPDSIEYLEPQSINGLNLYCYCMNNPIMYIDPSGHFVISTFIGIIIVIGAVAATANDIYQIARGEDDGEGLKVSVSGDSVHIENSYKLLTPWMRYGYSFYLNHINPDTKDVIQGSTFGVQFEWELHNYAAWLGIGGEKAKHLDVGKSIFADGKDHPLIDKNGEISVFGIMSLGMRIYYMLYANPIDLIWDIIVNGGF